MLASALFFFSSMSSTSNLLFGQLLGPSVVREVVCAPFTTNSVEQIILNHGSAITVWSPSEDDPSAPLVPVLSVPLVGVALVMRRCLRRHLFLLFDSDECALLHYDVANRKVVLDAREVLTCPEPPAQHSPRRDSPIVAVGYSGKCIVTHMFRGSLQVAFLEASTWIEFQTIALLDVPLLRDIVFVCDNERGPAKVALLAEPLKQSDTVRTHFNTRLLPLHLCAIRKDGKISLSSLAKTSVPTDAMGLIPLRSGAVGVVAEGSLTTLFDGATNTTNIHPPDGAPITACVQTAPRAMLIGTARGSLCRLDIADVMNETPTTITALPSWRPVCCSISKLLLLELDSFVRSCLVITAAGHAFIVDVTTGEQIFAFPARCPVTSLSTSEVAPSRLLVAHGYGLSGGITLYDCGFPLELLAEVDDVVGCSDVFVLHPKGKPPALILSFLNETRALTLGSGEELSELTLGGLDVDCSTIVVASLDSGCIIQITPRSVRCIAPEGEQVCSCWSPGATIDCAALEGNCAAAVSDSALHLIAVNDRDNSLKASSPYRAQSEISCVEINGPHIFLGTWIPASIELLQWDSSSNAIVQTATLPLPSIARSLRYLATSPKKGRLFLGQTSGGVWFRDVHLQPDAQVAPCTVEDFEATWTSLIGCLHPARFSTFRKCGKRLVFDVISGSLSTVSNWWNSQTTSWEYECKTVVLPQTPLCSTAVDRCFGSEQDVHIVCGTSKLFLGNFGRKPTMVESSHRVLGVTVHRAALHGSVLVALVEDVDTKCCAIKTFDSATFVEREAIALRAGEVALSLAHLSSPTSGHLAVAGTAGSAPQQEGGRLLLLYLAPLRIAFEAPVKGGGALDMAVTSHSDYGIFLHVANRLGVVVWKLDGERLFEVASTQSMSCCTSVSALGSLVAAGDIYHGVELYRLELPKGESSNGVVELRAVTKDPMPIFTTCSAVLDESGWYLRADYYRNLCAIRTVLQNQVTIGACDATCHMSTVFNVMHAASIAPIQCSTPPLLDLSSYETPASIAPMTCPVLCAGIDGSVQYVTGISSALHRVLARLQNTILSVGEDERLIGASFAAVHRYKMYGTVGSKPTGAVSHTVLSVFSEFAEDKREQVAAKAKSEFPNLSLPRVEALIDSLALFQ